MTNSAPLCPRRGLFAGEIIQDGKIHRCKAEGDKGGERSGWYVFYPDNLPAGAFGDWRAGTSERWCAKGEHELTPEERETYRRRMAESRDQREAEEKARHEEAAREAERRWNEATTAPEDHPYLVKKKVKPHGARVDAEGNLIFALRDASGKIWTTETISPTGDKKFQYGGKKRACFFALGTAAEVEKSGLLLIAEGFATAASLREATGFPVEAAMDAGNLRPVAEALRAKYIEAIFIFGADRDENGRGEKDAREAAQAVGGHVALCPEPGDFNDLAQAKGAETVKAAVEAALRATEPEGNGRLVDLVPNAHEARPVFDHPPVLLDAPDLPPLRADLFSGWLGDMVEAVSLATETPPELAALLGLGAVAACAQGRFEVSPSPQYREPLCIFASPALDSGNRKTAVLLEMTRPLREWEREQAEKLQPQVDKTASERKTLEARVDHLRKKQAAKAEGQNLENLTAEIAEIERTMPEIPNLPRLWAQDVTPERLGSLMAENAERIAILSDEAGIFEILEGRYSNGMPNLDLFLQGHAGAPVRVDRGSRAPVHLQRPALTVALSPQPDVIRGLALKPGFRGRGLLARFLYALPPSPLGWRTLEVRPVPYSVRAAYDLGLRAILDTPPTKGEDERTVPVVFGFSEDGFQEWKEFARSIEVAMREGEKFAGITDWAGKLPGAAARIAGLLHLVEHAGAAIPQEITLPTIQRALEIAAILSEHALAAFSLMGADPAIETARRVWRWIEREHRAEFTARDGFQALKGTFKRMAELQPALDVLVERYYIAEPTRKNIGAAGRPSRVFHVNPALAEGWA